MTRQRSLLDRATDYALSALEATGGDPLRLPIELQTVVLITAAQGVIDNGGFQYFFESDFPGTPSYSCFADAYRRVGALETSQALEAAITLFGFPQPYLSASRRSEFLDSGSQQARELLVLGDTVCGDESIWSHLAEYVAANATAFQAAQPRKPRTSTR